MKDREVAEFVNELTETMKNTPKSQMRAVLSRSLVDILREVENPKKKMMNWPVTKSWDFDTPFC